MKALIRCIVASLLVLTSLGCAFALDVPSLTGRVVDTAGVLQGAEKETLESTLRALEEATTAQVVVLTMKTLESEDPTDFAQRVFESWKLGQAKTNNGLLVLLTVDERRIRIHTGYGLEGAIPDAEAWHIIRKVMAPKLRRGTENYFEALRDGVEHIARLVRGEQQPGARPISSTIKTEEGVLILFGVILVVAAFAGMVHTMAGGVVGALGAGAASWAIFGLSAGLIGLIVGFLVGLVAKFILDIVLQVGLSGATGGFSGGGGLSGGGGASGDF